MASGSPKPRDPSFNYSTGWRTEWDSSYAVLSKFAYQNGFGARDLARLFISRNCGRKTKIVRSPFVDLRDNSLFDLDELSRLTIGAVEIIERGFIVPALQPDLADTSEYLQFCRFCMDDLLHVCAYQLREVETCPVHACALVCRCPHCGALIPYRLAPSVFADPFCCATCHRFLGFDDSWQYKREIRIPHATLVALSDMATLLQRRSALFRAWSRDGPDFRCGQGAGVILPRKGAGYGIDRWLKFIERATRLVAADGAATGRGADDPGCIAKGPARQIRTRKHRTSSLGRESSGQRFERRIAEAELLYRLLRRRLWGREMRPHRECFRSAVEHLWWDIEGESLPAICPYAEAFMRWRMHWEEVAVPKRLSGAPAHGPWRIAGWVLGDAPFLPSHWSTAGADWLTLHVFAATCLEHFRQLLARCERWRAAQRPRQWARADSCLDPNLLWVTWGHDRVGDPLRIVFDHPGTSLPRMTPQSVKAHRAWHLRELALMVR